MPRTKTSAQTPQLPARPAAADGVNGAQFDVDVLNLAEAAAYLRLPEPEVVRLVREQGLPGQQAGTEWRFLRTAIQDWLRQPSSKKNAGIWAFAGAWKDDPYVEEMLKDIYRKRGRPMTEEG